MPGEDASLHDGQINDTNPAPEPEVVDTPEHEAVVESTTDDADATTDQATDTPAEPVASEGPTDAELRALLVASLTGQPASATQTPASAPAPQAATAPATTPTTPTSADPFQPLEDILGKDEARTLAAAVDARLQAATAPLVAKLQQYEAQFGPIAQDVQAQKERQVQTALDPIVSKLGDEAKKVYGDNFQRMSPAQYQARQQTLQVAATVFQNAAAAGKPIPEDRAFEFAHALLNGKAPPPHPSAAVTQIRQNAQRRQASRSVAPGTAGGATGKPKFANETEAAVAAVNAKLREFGVANS